MRGLHEWGNQVWVHTSDGTKLDGCSRIGRWIGYDEISNRHKIYWPNKHSVTIECSIKFVNDDVIFLLNPITELIQGENDLSNNKDQWHDLETKSLEDEDEEPDTENHQDDPSNPITKNPSTKVIDFVTDKQNQHVPENQATSEARSQRTRTPTRYIKDIQSGVGMINDRSGKLNLPVGIQIPKPITQIQRETADTSQIEHAMTIAVSEIEAIDPLSLEEAMRWPNHLKWRNAIQEELNNLWEAGTWTVVERPKERNIVKNKWVFRIKKDAAGKIKQYKARLIEKGFIQVFGIDYYNMWAPMAKLGLIHLLLATAAQHGWPINMFNFHSAFLNSKLDSDEEVFMEQPQGYYHVMYKVRFVELLHWGWSKE